MVSCRLCLQGYFAYHYQFDGFSAYLPFHDFLRHIQTRRAHRRLTEPLLLKPYMIPTVSDDPTLNLFSSQLRAVAAHVAPYSDEAIARFFWQHETRRGASWQWDMWYSEFPADACALPNIWQPDYGRRFAEHDLTRLDRQVIATAIPPEFILGAIKVSDGVRFLPSIRPNRRRGETLAAKLWVIVRRLRAEYRGRALVIE